MTFGEISDSVNVTLEGQMSARLSFEVKPSDDCAEVFVYMDRAGLDYLIKELIRLRWPDHEHFHMVSEAWGSNELTEELSEPNSLPARHVKFFLRPEGEALITPSPVPGRR
jgi:hypothetical protein